MLSQNALMSQSWTDRRGETNLDGWGISCYEDIQPWLQKNGLPAYRDSLFSQSVERIYACTVVAHIRQATVGGFSVENAHPFVFGRWTFAHNGTLSSFPEMERELLAELDPDLRALRRGQTDSELMFYWLLTRMRKVDGADATPYPGFEPTMTLLRDALGELDRRAAAHGDEEESQLNFVLTDGRTLFATRYRADLYMQLQAGVHVCDACGRDHLLGDAPPDLHSVTIASEPLNDRPWQELPCMSVTGVDENLVVYHLPV